MGKVRYGLSNAHYALYDEEKGTYGTPKPIKGAVSMSIEASGDSSTFYADNVAYETFTANGGYTGTLEVALLEDEALIDLLGYEKDANGLVFENAAGKQASFALLYEVAGNQSDVRFAFYACKLSRPSQEANTTNESIEVDTQSLDLTCVARDFEYGDGTVPVVKGHIEKKADNAAVYGDFFKTVQVPTKASA